MRRRASPTGVAKSGRACRIRSAHARSLREAADLDAGAGHDPQPAARRRIRSTPAGRVRLCRSGGAHREGNVAGARETDLESRRRSAARLLPARPCWVATRARLDRHGHAHRCGSARFNGAQRRGRPARCLTRSRTRTCIRSSDRTHVRQGAWRSVAHTQHGFFTKSFIDELAHARRPGSVRLPARPARRTHRGIAPCSRRRQGSPDWGTPPPAGRGRGIALVESFGSIVARGGRGRGRRRHASRCIASAQRSTAATS